MKLKAVAVLVGMCLANQASAQLIIVGRPFGPPRGGVVVVIKTTYVNPPWPILGPGYSQDTRGVDLDLFPPKKTKPPGAVEPLPSLGEMDAGKPLPGVEVSKPRPSVRPEEAVPPPPKAKAPRPRPVAADLPRDQAGLMDLGLNEFQAGEYGVAALRFRKAAALGPKQQARAYFFLAQAEAVMGNYRDAVATIQAGMKIDKLWPQLAIQPRRDLFGESDADYDNHLRRLGDSLAAQPNHPALLFLMAHQLWFDGRRADALALFQRARPLADNPAFIDAFLAAGDPGKVAANTSQPSWLLRACPITDSKFACERQGLSPPSDRRDKPGGSPTLEMLLDAPLAPCVHNQSSCCC